MTLSIKISEEIVDKLKLGIWRIVNKGTNYKEVGWAQGNKDSACLEGDVRGLILGLIGKMRRLHNSYDLKGCNQPLNTLE